MMYQHRVSIWILLQMSDGREGNITIQTKYDNSSAQTRYAKYILYFELSEKAKIRRQFLHYSSD
jgi:hypothetical protein